MNPEDEPLDRWAARREGRLRKPGELKALTLGAGPRRAAHLDPGAPRLILEWDGFQWVAVTVVDDYAAACRLLNPAPRPQPQEQPAPRKRGGRHRRPRA
ncbi:hypothetical protein BCL76_101750 [Streptomyces sp. CG 926]|uniref:DUF6087 family protein n=1 Tax=unclassified Streptomyces TaxID=2593676 RepID=UPI000D6C59A2|nr:DUF6087 family protein [Streptomyces sp. CG 926]PWK75015.1 hypothetical protein BCL76_101750 [Streptomyces sp. CG 926]